MIKNKKGSTTKDYIVMALTFSVCVALFAIMFGSLAVDYDNTEIINEEFSSTFDRFDNDSAKVGEMWQTIDTKEGLSLIGGVFEIFFKGTFTIVRLIVSSVATAGDQIFGFLNFFDIPSEISGIIGTLLFSLLSIMIVYAVINAVNAKREL